MLSFCNESHGGPLFLKLLLTHMTASDETSKESLIKLVDTYKISTMCAGEIITDVCDVLRPVTETVYSLHNDSLPLNYIDKVISVFQTTSVPLFNELFEELQKSVTAARLQRRLRGNYSVTSSSTGSPANDLPSVLYVLSYAETAYNDKLQKGEWDKCLQKTPGESTFTTPSDTNATNGQ